jgi:hypothetical protein
MANGGTHAGIVTGLDLIEAATHPGIIGFIEGLELMKTNRITLARGKTVHGKAVTGRSQAFSKKKNMLPP